MAIQTFMGESLSVTELIAELQKVSDPDTTPVFTAGCDCNGTVSEVHTDGEGVMLERGN